MFDKLMEKAFDKFTRKDSDDILLVTESFSLLFFEHLPEMAEEMENRDKERNEDIARQLFDKFNKD